MSLLNFGEKDHQRPRNRKSLELVLGVGALVGVIALGSTLAASINLNGSGPVEFGQGVAQTTACDSQIIVTPFSQFDNSYGVQEFVLSSIEISDIANACEAKRFQINIYGTSDNPLNSDGKIEVDLVSDDGDLYFDLFSDIDYADLEDWNIYDDDDGLGDLGSTTEYGSSNFIIDDIYDENGDEILAEDILSITVETIDATEGVITYSETSFDWLVLAAGERSAVEAETVLHSPLLHNGSYWYYTPLESRGFSLNQTISQISCDIDNPNGAYRLCWHIYDNDWISEGYRAGDNRGGNVSGILVRAIYTAETPPSYYPSGPQINVPKSDLISGGWTRCYYGDYGVSVTNAEVSTCTGTYVLYAGGYPDPTR
jgi:hypothetical protein